MEEQYDSPRNIRTYLLNIIIKYNMSIRKVISNKYILNLCLLMISFKLHFNHLVKYKKKHKQWIIIKENTITWNHIYSELKYLLNNINFSHLYTNKEIDEIQNMRPKNYFYKKRLKNLIVKDCTKYEVFTSKIINFFIDLPDKVFFDTFIVIHIKHTRKENNNNDEADFTVLYTTIYKSITEKEVYKISETQELDDLIYNFIGVKFIIFTDWRELYRNNLSLSYSEYKLMPKIVLLFFSWFRYSIYAVIQNKNNMYALDISV